MTAISRGSNRNGASSEMSSSPSTVQNLSKMLLSTYAYLGPVLMMLQESICKLIAAACHAKCHI